MLEDYVVRAAAFNGQVRAFSCRTTRLVEELRVRHQTSPTVSAALGRTASVGLMMGVMLKGKEKLTIQVRGNGPAGKIVVDSNSNGEVRGYADDPTVDLPLNAMGKLDVAGAVGTEGHIYVIKDLGLKEPYRGSVPIISGELGEDFTYYFTVSEQTPSAVAVGVLVNTDYSIKAAGGLIVQIMPGLEDENISKIEQAIGQMPAVTTLIDEGVTPEEMLIRVLGDSIKLFQKTEASFQCTCDKERIESMLISLGADEIQEIIEDTGEAEVICHFCNEKYLYTKKQLESLVLKIKE